MGMNSIKPTTTTAYSELIEYVENLTSQKPYE